MDTSSSSSPSSCFSSSKYDVFLSFRAEDTGRTFVSHLSRSLDQKGIRTYKDENQQATDGKISTDVAKAIRESNIAVVVVSENYASSSWCLDVLAEIVESSMVIKPVFYEVNPADFMRHRESESYETVDRWRNAFQRLENTRSRFCSRDWEDDSKMLDSLIISISQAMSTSQRDFESASKTVVISQTPIVKNISTVVVDHISISFSSFKIDEHHVDNLSNEMLDPSPTRFHSFESAHLESAVQRRVVCSPNGLVGMDRHKKAVYGFLDLESKSQVLTVGIWGLEGVGKTTLAECVFEDISHHFQHRCFLTNVNNNHQNRISPSLREHFTKTGCSNDDSFDAIKPSLVNRNLLLVVDGVHDNEQFKDIAKLAHWLGPGSRVIMTSRDENLLASCGVNYVYKVDCLRYEEALQLFSHYAFKKTYPLTGFERFSVRAVLFSGRLPLSLKVLGSFLYGKDEKSWKSTLRRLDALQDNSTREVSSYIAAYERLPRHQIAEMERYVGADEGEYSPSYHILL